MPNITCWRWYIAAWYLSISFQPFYFKLLYTPLRYKTMSAVTYSSSAKTMSAVTYSSSTTSLPSSLLLPPRLYAPLPYTSAETMIQVPLSLVQQYLDPGYATKRGRDGTQQRCSKRRKITSTSSSSDESSSSSQPSVPTAQRVAARRRSSRDMLFDILATRYDIPLFEIPPALSAPLAPLRRPSTNNEL